jgi:hypothetical protein
MKRLCSFYSQSKSIAFFFVFIYYSFVAYAAPYADYNAEIHSCYDLIINLKIAEANQKIVELKLSQPDNIAIIHMQNYLDFFLLFITENRNEYDLRSPNKNKRIELLDKIKLNDPHLDFIKAEILLQWTLIHLKFDDKLKAGSSVYDAYKYLEKNKSVYPDFIENYKSLSIIHAIAASVPSWVRKVIGVNGSIALGKAEIEKIANYAYKDKNYIFREEVASINSYILFYQLNEKNKAIAELEKFNLNHKSNPLLAFLKASMYLRNGDNEHCLKILNEHISSSSQLPFYYLDFMKGRSLLYKQNPDAMQYLKVFVNNFKGEHFIKEAYQKLAWFELTINDDLVKYKYYMSLCLNKGNQLVDEDKQAYKEAKSTKTPNSALLKARILYDGGYYSKAEQVLIKNAENLQDQSYTQLEFNYRMARILQSLKNYPDAIYYFKNTLALDPKSKDYFTASASLQLGFIYEDQKQYKSAKYYYEKCLSMDPPEYKNSIHQKAKSGVQRMK